MEKKIYEQSFKQPKKKTTQKCSIFCFIDHSLCLRLFHYHKFWISTLVNQWTLMWQNYWHILMKDQLSYLLLDCSFVEPVQHFKNSKLNHFKNLLVFWHDVLLWTKPNNSTSGYIYYEVVRMIFYNENNKKKWYCEFALHYNDTTDNNIKGTNFSAPDVHLDNQCSDKCNKPNLECEVWESF